MDNELICIRMVNFIGTDFRQPALKDWCEGDCNV